MRDDITGPAATRALRHVASLATGAPLDPGLRLTLNFHPDRTAGDRPLLQALTEDGVYRSQFVTGTSNGGLTAHPGGDRWRWESRMFGGAYDRAPAHERPVYGALNFRRRPFGAAHRFGSSHFRLTPDTLGRATFCYPDSAAEPSDFGTAVAMPLIDLAAADDQDVLNDYVEAQVHGPVVLARHVEALVLDSAYRGTEVEEAARRLPCPVEWHAGFRLTVEELRRHPDYRGREYTDLGASIAENGRLDPRIIGEATRTGRHALQSLKMVWHCLARFGAPPAPSTHASAAAPSSLSAETAGR
ncbi:DUF3626 domain-containing protein [Streptomyces xinghaiensis]|uniref:DUF3626 domain-containing protein n=1 Tax=Streptomyces xinghaiensis TaxID=1038928 RepID=UPI00342C5BBA